MLISSHLRKYLSKKEILFFILSSFFIPFPPFTTDPDPRLLARRTSRTWKALVSFTSLEMVPEPQCVKHCFMKKEDEMKMEKDTLGNNNTVV